ncbi:MAG: hypothetical protein C0615_07420 [Desulfuromonas sp.]|nr:MAG: hypothetical protein C0615_07420 [Desulfuromonas sp.]
MEEEFAEEEYKTEGRGRSAKKREAKAIEKLAERLVELPENELANLPLDQMLMVELTQARQTKGHSSRKREIKHFAGLLRRDDEARERLQEALSEFDFRHGQETQTHHDLERLREMLCSPESQDEALRKVATDFPSVDRKALQRLVKAVLHSNDKRAYREIFRRLKEGQE